MILKSFLCEQRMGLAKRRFVVKAESEVDALRWVARHPYYGSIRVLSAGEHNRLLREADKKRHKETFQ